MRALLSVAFALGGLCAPGVSQQVAVGPTAHHGAIVVSERGLVLPAGHFAVTELVDAVAAYLCRNYVYDPVVLSDAEGFVLQRSLALDALGSEEVLYALLAARGLAALPLDETRGLYQVVALDPAHDGSRPMAPIPWRRPQDLLLRPGFRELVVTAVTLDHLDADRVANALRTHFALQRTWQPGAPVASAAGPDTLVLHGYGDQVAQTIRALREVDRLSAAAPRAPAVDVAALLARLDALEREVAELKRALAERR